MKPSTEEVEGKGHVTKGVREVRCVILIKIPTVSEAVFLICEMGTIRCFFRGYHVTPRKMRCRQYVLVHLFLASQSRYACPVLFVFILLLF